MKHLCIVIGECRFDWLIVAESPHVADKVCKLSFNSLNMLPGLHTTLFHAVKITFFPFFFNLRLGHSDLVLLGLTRRR